MQNNIKIIFQNNHYAIVDKQSGIIVNKSDTTTGEITLQDLIISNKIIDLKDENSEFIKKSGIVHRLDKETSGLIIIAKNSKSFFEIQKQFKDRTVEKNYLALVHGEVKPKFGDISAPIGRLPWNRMRFGVLAGGREAKTGYETIQLYKEPRDKSIFTLLRLFPKTGRTHQIRVHLKHIGYPIVSDPLYGGRKVSRRDRKVLSRIFLHAEKISFIDPGTKEKVTFVSGLPKKLEEYLYGLEKI